MNKLMIAIVCATVVGSVRSEEFGASAVAVESASASVAAEQAIMDSEAARSNESAEDQMDAFVEEQISKHGSYKVGGWDRKNERIIVKAVQNFTVQSRDVEAKYLELRNAMFDWVLLDAKIKIVMQLGSGEMSATRKALGWPDHDMIGNDQYRHAAAELLGCTVLEQWESCIPEGNHFNCQIAILYSWSKENAKIAKHMQTVFNHPERPALTMKSGKNSLEGWCLKKKKIGALGEWIGPRRYIDAEGVVWMMGIGAAPLPANTRRADDQRDIARSQAEAELGWAIYSDAKMTNVVNKVMEISKLEAFDDLTDDQKSKISIAIRKEKSESTRYNTTGVEYPFEGTVKDASGQNIFVCVAAMSEQSKKEKLGILRENEDAAREVRESRDRERTAAQRKIGVQKKTTAKPCVSTADEQAKKAEKSAGGRLGTGTRHYSSDDE